MWRVDRGNVSDYTRWHCGPQPLRHNGCVDSAGIAMRSAAGGPSPEEAAAIVAAVERFVRETAPPPAAPAAEPAYGWHAAAMLEGVSRDPWALAHDPWVDHARSLP